MRSGGFRILICPDLGFYCVSLMGDLKRSVILRLDPCDTVFSDDFDNLRIVANIADPPVIKVPDFLHLAHVSSPFLKLSPERKMARSTPVRASIWPSSSSVGIVTLYSILLSGGAGNRPEPPVSPKAEPVDTALPHNDEQFSFGIPFEQLLTLNRGCAHFLFQTISSSVLIGQQLALKIKNRNGSISEVEAVKVAAAILQEADKHCFPGWWNSSSVDPELSRSLLLLIAERFSTLGLLAGDAMEFIGQLVQVLRRAHYKPGRRDDT
jgi:hypothetical protein